MSKAVKTIEAEVLKPKTRKLKTKRCQSWEVWSIVSREMNYEESFNTKKEAMRHVAGEDYISPVLVHVDIPPMEYLGPY